MDAIIISVDTLNPMHLIPRFIDAVDTLKEDASLIKGDTFKDDFNRIDDILSDIEQRMDSEDYFDTEDPCFDLETLVDLLVELTPEGLYFGVSEGDGACFGYWPEELDDELDI